MLKYYSSVRHVGIALARELTWSFRCSTDLKSEVAMQTNVVRHRTFLFLLPWQDLYKADHY